jgi:phage-related protein
MKLSNLRRTGGGARRILDRQAAKKRAAMQKLNNNNRLRFIVKIRKLDRSIKQMLSRAVVHTSAYPRYSNANVKLPRDWFLVFPESPTRERGVSRAQFAKLQKATKRWSDAASKVQGMLYSPKWEGPPEINRVFTRGKPPPPKWLQQMKDRHRAQRKSGIIIATILRFNPPKQNIVHVPNNVSVQTISSSSASSNVSVQTISSASSNAPNNAANHVKTPTQLRRVIQNSVQASQTNVQFTRFLEDIQNEIQAHRRDLASLFQPRTRGKGDKTDWYLKNGVLQTRPSWFISRNGLVQIRPPVPVRNQNGRITNAQQDDRWWLMPSIPPETKKLLKTKHYDATPEFHKIYKQWMQTILVLWAVMKQTNKTTITMWKSLNEEVRKTVRQPSLDMMTHKAYAQHFLGPIFNQ